MAQELSLLNNFEKSQKTFELLLQVQPKNPYYFFEYGRLLERWGKVDPAVGAYLSAIKLNPKFAEAYNNLGNMLTTVGQLPEASQAFMRALEFKPDLQAAISNHLANLNYRDDLSAEVIFEEHKRLGQSLVERFGGNSKPHTHVPDTSRRLRIGFISPDLYRHSVIYYLLPYLRHHDRQQFEVYCYYTGHIKDDYTDDARKLAARWYDVLGRDETELTALIQGHEIDILIDLCGQFSRNSLPVFAAKPAPVQVTWLGYPNTTGLDAVDYRITDAIVDPEGHSESLYTEELLRLDDGYHCFSPQKDAPEAGLPPYQQNGYITFGSFNNNLKISESCVALWSAVLHAVEGSRLLLKSKWFGDPTVQASYLRLFAGEGIPEERITLLSWADSPRESLQRYDKIDIALDTLPYNGTTTTCESLWQGVPVLTLKGSRAAGRVGASLLSCIGREDWVAATPEAFVELAAKTAADHAGLTALRKTLRAQVQASP